MKSIIALSIGLAFSTASLAEEPSKVTKTPNAIEKTQAVVKNILTFAQNNPSDGKTEKTVTPPTKLPMPASSTIASTKPLLTSSPATSEVKKLANDAKFTENEHKLVKPLPKKKLHKKPIHKSDPKVAKEELKPTKSETNYSTSQSELLGTEAYYIPYGANMEEHAKFAKPISYNDVALEISKNKKHVNVSFTDKRTNNTLDKFYVDNSEVKILSLDISLKDSKYTEINYNQQSSYRLSLSDNECNVIFVQYKLKTESAPEKQIKYLDRDGNLTNTLPRGCRLPNLSNLAETTFYTKTSHIVNIGFNQKAISNKTLGMTLHFTHEGHEYFPNNLQVYAVAKDYSDIYFLNAKASTKGPYFGVDVFQSVNPNAYHIIIEHQPNKNVEHFISSTTVR